MAKLLRFADFVVENHGSICILRALTPEGREWADANLQVEDWQMWGRDGVAIEPRYVEDILAGISDAGMTWRA